MCFESGILEQCWTVEFANLKPCLSLCYLSHEVAMEILHFYTQADGTRFPEFFVSQVNYIEAFKLADREAFLKP